ncbi:hypothetical protein Q73_02435 [Bacillus coahuilensis m2-6]|uniref:heparan-alpha-glucosaminide N-acetyltransferase domain-containing protein n=1 Tax=Bacillus coahuilensis TaxID=408580 RepID=UPI0007502467|nr:heparan-alpha-glucosaminide N-acetyltransferase domain-containing protein [Bacillus coahuilensis]KUP09608.1 hypothetical protein Q73_02435 [Bacillus coahuilensis m2-6]
MGETKRIIGFDVARAFAIFGMVIVNYKIAMNAEGNGPYLESFMRDFEGRAAAIFVIVAGVGVSLMTKGSREMNDMQIVREDRKSLWKGSVFLLVLGFLLILLGWTADILHYYAFYLFLGSFFITSSTRVLIISAIFLLVLSQTSLLVLDYTKGWDSSFTEYETFWTFAGFVRNLLFNGYHPIFPWFFFILMGMILGRLDFTSIKVRRYLLIGSSVGAIVFELLSSIFILLTQDEVGLEIAEYLFLTKPMPPNFFYMISSSCTGVFIIRSVLFQKNLKRRKLFNHSSILASLRLFMFLTSFYCLFLMVLGYLDHASLVFVVTSSCWFFIGAIVFSRLWRKRYKRGPIELLMRRVSG